MPKQPDRLWHRQRTVLRIAKVGPTILIPPVLLGLVLSGLYVAQAWISSAIFTQLLGGRAYATIVQLILALGLVLVAIPLVGVAKAYLINRIGLRLKLNLRHAILSYIDERGPMRLSAQRAGMLESLMVDGVENIEPYYGAYLPQIAITTITAASLCIWIGTVSPFAGIVLFVCAVATFVIPRLWDKVLAEKGQAHWNAYSELNADFIDAMAGMTTLKAFGAADQFGERLATRSRELLQSTLTQLRVSLGETGASAAMMIMGPAFALAIAIMEVRQGTYPVSQLFFITLLSIEVFRPLRDLANAFHAGYFGLAAADEIYSTLPTDQVAEYGDDRVLAALPSTVPATITIADLTYRYDQATDDALHGVSMRIAPGEFAALVGSSGSGKSTLLGLLLGFDSPKSGTVAVGGIAADDLDVVATVSLVPQQPVLFPGTVEAMLQAANPKASREDALRALTIAKAYNFRAERDGSTPRTKPSFEDDAGTQQGQEPIASSQDARSHEGSTPDNEHAVGEANADQAQPNPPSHNHERNKPDSGAAAAANASAQAAGEQAQASDLSLVIEESAANISGGQKQRLAIARALIRNPRVLILDESTSALDSQVERTILTNLRTAYPEMTLILVTHRMDIAQLADTVTVLGKGRIVEHGTPADLLASKHAFHEMVANASTKVFNNERQGSQA